MDTNKLYRQLKTTHKYDSRFKETIRSYEDIIAPYRNNYEACVEIVNYAMKYNFGSDYKDISAKVNKQLQEFNNKHKTKLTKSEFISLLKKVLKDDEFTLDTLSNKEIKGVEEIISDGKMPSYLINAQRQAIDYGKYVINKADAQHRTVMKQEFLKLWDDFYVLIRASYMYTDVFYEDIPHIFKRLDAKLKAKRVTPTKRTCKTTRKTTRRVRR